MATKSSPFKVSWRCRHGFHSWMFLWMGDERIINVPGHPHQVCSIIEGCRRCPITRARRNADIPKRVRT